MFSIQSFLTWVSLLLMTYKHLNQVKKYQIHALTKAGHNQSQIARLLDRNKSTISRELGRNRGARGWRSKQACKLSANREQKPHNAANVAQWVWQEARTKLRLHGLTPLAARVKTLTFQLQGVRC